MLVVVLLSAGANASCDGGDEGSAESTSTEPPGTTTVEVTTTSAPPGSTSTEPPGTTTVEVTTTSAPPGSTSTDPPGTSTVEPTTTAAPISGAAGPGCVSGWVTPARGDPLRTQPLDIIRAQMGVTGQFEVVEMRYFTGPEVPWILAPRPEFVHRWYVKARLVDDPSFRARWLVEKRSANVEGIAGVAPFDSRGYQSPDWRSFLGESDEPRPVEGVPGTWFGFEYDFVTGEDGEKPGLPDEVIGCLDGT